MARLTLANLIDDVSDELPGKAQAPIVRSANKVIRRIHTEFTEPERGTFTTTPEVTSGTVAVTEGDTAVTFSGSVMSATNPLALVSVDGDSAWFNVTRGAGDTDGVLSSAWAEATDAAATYTLVYPTITFPSKVGELLEIRRHGAHALLFRSGGGIPYTTGVPQTWSPYVIDEAATPDDSLRIMLDPAPTERIVYFYWFRRRTTFLDAAGATTQTVPFADIWYEVIVQGTLMFLWKQEANKEKALIADALYSRAINRTRGALQPAAVIPPRDAVGGLYAYEDRPVTDV